MPTFTASPDLARTKEPRLHKSIWLFMLIFIAIGLRMMGLGLKSFWLDESASSLLAHSDWPTFGTALAHRQANMSLYYFLLRGWIHFGDSEAGLRLLSVVLGVASIPLLYVVAERICGTRTARFTALLMTIHVFHIQYSQEARGYSLVLFLTLASCYFFVQLTTESSKMTLPMYVAASVLMVYAHIFGVLILLAQWSFGFLAGRTSQRRRRLAIALIVISLLISPLFFCLLFLSDRSQLSWMGTDSASGLYEFLLDLSGRGGLPLLLLFVVLLAVSLSAHLRSAHCQTYQSSYFFLWAWLIVPPAITALVALHIPALQSRYLIICLPAYLILAAHGLASLHSRLSIAVATIAVSVFLLLAVNPYYRARVDPNRTDDWLDATRYVLSRAQPGDALVFPYSAEEIPFRDYERRLGKDDYIPLLPQQTDLQLLTWPGTWISPEMASSMALQHRRVWVISALQTNAHSQPLITELNAKLETESRVNFGFVRIQIFEPRELSGAR